MNQDIFNVFYEWVRNPSSYKTFNDIETLFEWPEAFHGHKILFPNEFQKNLTAKESHICTEDLFNKFLEIVPESRIGVLHLEGVTIDPATKNFLFFGVPREVVTIANLEDIKRIKILFDTKILFGQEKGRYGIVEKIQEHETYSCGDFLFLFDSVELFTEYKKISWDEKGGDFNVSKEFFLVSEEAILSLSRDNEGDVLYGEYDIIINANGGLRIGDFYADSNEINNNTDLQSVKGTLETLIEIKNSRAEEKKDFQSPFNWDSVGREIAKRIKKYRSRSKKIKTYKEFAEKKLSLARRYLNDYSKECRIPCLNKVENNEICIERK